MKNYIGKTIKKCHIRDNILYMHFEDGTKIKIYDCNHHFFCSEKRWMHTDDDLNYHIGARLNDVEVKESKVEQFVIITTSRGCITLVNYNEHNGYYGGFELVIE